MKVDNLSSDRLDLCWEYHITVDNSKWPDIGHLDEWSDRPIYRWVMDNCWPVSFAYYGEILLGNGDDANWFRMVWE